MTRAVRFVKAHAYGNDFVLVPSAELEGLPTAPLAKAACNRHRGIGADGFITYHIEPSLVTMRLWNADGSLSELSGNGLRCLAALVSRTNGSQAITIRTDAGDKQLQLERQVKGRYYFRAAMGAPGAVSQQQLAVGGEDVTATIMSIGNPQCVILDGPLHEERLHRIGPAVEQHPIFPNRTNVELAHVESPNHLQILIWERGVGPTEASGTGACAAAVAAMLFANASRDVRVVSPGGSQRVEWRDEGLYLTGWSEIVCQGSWTPSTDSPDA